MIEVSVDDAYREACLALGEAVVRERLLLAETSRLTAEAEALRARLRQPEAAGPE